MESTEADAAGRLFTAASTGNLEVVKNLVTANGALIRAADQQGLYPGFTGRDLLSLSRRRLRERWQHN